MCDIEKNRTDKNRTDKNRTDKLTKPPLGLIPWALVDRVTPLLSTYPRKSIEGAAYAFQFGLTKYAPFDWYLRESYIFSVITENDAAASKTQQYLASVVHAYYRHRADMRPPLGSHVLPVAEDSQVAHVHHATACLMILAHNMSPYSTEPAKSVLVAPMDNIKVMKAISNNAVCDLTGALVKHLSDAELLIANYPEVAK